MNPEYVSSFTNHLWQSTVFAGLAGLLTLTLRNNHARVRHGVWLAASCKFLIPFSVLVAMGGHIRWQSAPNTTRSTWSAVMEEVSQPFTALAVSSPLLANAPPAAGPLPGVVFGIWASAFLGISCSWWIRWRRIRAAVRAGSPLPIEIPIKTITSPNLLEPAVFGVFRPVLLLPEGIFDRLTTAQLEGVIAHELCHVRHRDNLIATLHMFVETIFWFHPMVWWIGRRMVEERERGCDEEVLKLGCEKRVYAQSILRVCEFYHESSAACVAGITGADLKRRIEAIMINRISRDLNFGRKLLLGATGMLAVAAPLVEGAINAPAIQAQVQPYTQSAVGTATRFEVASVKPNKSMAMRSLGFQTTPGGRLTAVGIPLYLAIEWAYGLSMTSIRMTGAPEWTRYERYDFAAKAAMGVIPPDLPAKVREQHIRPMLQALLADRFKLVVRRENKEVPVYAMTVAKGGLKMQKSSSDENGCTPTAHRDLPDLAPRPPVQNMHDDVPCHAIMGGQGLGMYAKAVSVGELITWVENWSDRPMIDRTELTGLYIIDTGGWAPLRGGSGAPGDHFDDPTRPTIFTVFERQLGLKLEPTKAPAEVYVIEHVERPTQN